MDKTAKAIKGQLFYNSGEAICDSGGRDGRAWQRWSDGKMKFDVKEQFRNTSIAVEYFLYNALERSKEAVQLEKRMIKELSEVSGEKMKALHFGYGSEMETAMANLEIQHGNPENTYNWDNDLSQTLQYFYIYPADRRDVYDSKFICLSIHGGADVRGGYSPYKVYEIKDHDQFFMQRLEDHGFMRAECVSCRKEEILPSYDYENQEEIPHDDNHVCKACMETSETIHDDVKAWKSAVKDWTALNFTPTFERGMASPKPQLSEYLGKA
jgi:hypothetical protein